MMCLPLVCFAISVLVQIAWGSSIHTTGATQNLGVSGGATISIESAPFMASLICKSKITKTYKSFCGGSIINEEFILTAAHCVKKSEYMHGGHYKAAALKILVGTDRLNEENQVLRKVVKKICNKGFDYVSDGDDICLLKLEEPLQFGPKVAKLDLPDEDLNLEAGTLVNVTGWGSTETTSTMMNDLRQVTVPIVSKTECKRSWRELNNWQICAGTRGHDACHGDSGGPLTYKNTVVGLVSYGFRCTTYSSGIGVYTRVSSYRKWINSVISKRGS